MHTYKAKVLEKIPNPSPDGRLVPTRTRIGIFRFENDQEQQIGEYERNYLSLFNTFCYFRKEDREYALYSRNYSATRIMELPSCKDLGGEEPSGSGFCPTDFYVPSYLMRETVLPDDKTYRGRIIDPKPEDFLLQVHKYSLRDSKTGKSTEVEKPSYVVSPQIYYPFGFVAGCIWGDDSTWKIQYLDLSEADKGIVKRDERFGYIVLPEKLSLKDAINLQDYSPEGNDPDTVISITIEKRFDIQTGEMQDY